MNPLLRLREAGQSVWLDLDLSEITDRLADGGLRAFQADLDRLLLAIGGQLEELHPNVGARNHDRSGHGDGGAAEPPAAGELRESC